MSINCGLLLAACVGRRYKNTLAGRCFDEMTSAIPRRLRFDKLPRASDENEEK
jgi:hypothetical protein